MASFSAVVLPHPGRPHERDRLALRRRDEREAVEHRPAPVRSVLRTLDELEDRSGHGLESASWRAVYDAVVIGGGPGGSTVATALARAGPPRPRRSSARSSRASTSASRCCPSRFRSSTGSASHDKIRAAGFQKKYGAFFWNEANGTTRPVVFAEARDPNHPMAYQVKRAEFDDLLLRPRRRPAAPRSARRRAVEDVLFEGGRAVGVRVARRRAARPEEIRAQVVVDASGQGAFLSRKLGLRRFDPKLKRAALFAHYEGIRLARRAAAPATSCCPIDQGVWYWIIPFSDGTCSVGGVFDPAEVRFAEGASVEATLRRAARAARRA